MAERYLSMNKMALEELYAKALNKNMNKSTSYMSLCVNDHHEDMQINTWFQVHA